MNFIYGNKANPEVNRFLCDFVGQWVFGQPNDFGPCGSLGICEGKTIIAACVFHGWQPEYGVVELSLASNSPRWFSRRSVREILGICFGQLGCQQTVCRVAVDNAKIIKVLDFLKFTRVLLPNMQGRGKHEYLMMLTSDEWKANRMSKSNEKNTQSA